MSDSNQPQLVTANIPVPTAKKSINHSQPQQVTPQQVTPQQITAMVATAQQIATASGPDVESHGQSVNLFGKDIKRTHLYAGIGVVLLSIFAYLWWCSKQQEKESDIGEYQEHDKMRRPVQPMHLPPEVLATINMERMRELDKQHAINQKNVAEPKDEPKPIKPKKKRSKKSKE